MPLKPIFWAWVVFVPARGGRERHPLPSHEFVDRNLGTQRHHNFGIVFTIFDFLLSLVNRVIIARILPASLCYSPKAVNADLYCSHLFACFAIPARHKVYLAQEWIQLRPFAYLYKQAQFVI